MDIHCRIAHIFHPSIDIEYKTIGTEDLIYKIVYFSTYTKAIYRKPTNEYVASSETGQNSQDLDLFSPTGPLKQNGFITGCVRDQKHLLSIHGPLD